ncbi:hypothetical protein ABT381_03330 [Streptomyces sp. NPDC000151]|uniref:hypothetical protein n=1 Tax=Streptomyces sp. NPDC000151 TaxID=3154244 RepID=UPI003316F83A
MSAQSAAEQNGADERERVLDAVLGPASEAYYADRVRSGSEARVRAQSAQSTVTLFAGGIVAALTFTQLADRSLLTRWAGVVAVALWLSAAVLYLRAVAQPVTKLAGPSHARDRLDLLNALLQRADDEAAQVDKRQRHANRVVVAALCLSVVTVGLAAVSGPEKELVPGSVLLTPSYAKSARTVCDLKGQRIVGRIDKGSLGKPFVRVAVSAKECGSGTAATELMVPRKAVRAIAVEGD